MDQLTQDEVVMSSPIPIEREIGSRIDQRPEEPTSNLGEIVLNKSTPLVIRQKQPALPTVWSELEQELGRIKSRHAAVYQTLGHLAATYASFPEEVRSSGDLSWEHCVLCLEIDDSSDARISVSGVLLEAVADIIRNAEIALSRKEEDWARVEISGADQFLGDAERNIQRLEMAVTAHRMAALNQGIEAMVVD